MGLLVLTTPVAPRPVFCCLNACAVAGSPPATFVTRTNCWQSFTASATLAGNGAVTGVRLSAAGRFGKVVGGDAHLLPPWTAQRDACGTAFLVLAENRSPSQTTNHLHGG